MKNDISRSWYLFLVCVIVMGLTYFLKYIFLSSSLFIIIGLAIFWSNIIKLRWKLILLSLLIYFFICNTTGTNVSLKTIFNAVSPVNIIYEESKGPNSLYRSNLNFPITKAVKIRVLNEKYLTKKPLPYLHYFASRNFYYNQAKSNIRNKAEYIHKSITIVCIMKNIGNKPLIINDIKNVSIIREEEDKNIADQFVVQLPNRKITGLKNILNMTKPIILRPLEEAILFTISPACSNESITLETEIEYKEYGENLDISQYDVALQKEKLKIIGLGSGFTSGITEISPIRINRQINGR